MIMGVRDFGLGCESNILRVVFQTFGSLFRADSSYPDNDTRTPMHNGLTEWGKVTSLNSTDIVSKCRCLFN